MEDAEDSIREDDAPSPAEIAAQLEQAEKRRLLAQSTAGPLTHAIQAKNSKHISHPDATMLREMEFRACPPAPADLLGVEPADAGDTVTGAVRAACEMLHKNWSDVAEASRDKDVSLEQLARAGQRVLKVALTPLHDCAKELDVRIAETQRRIDAAVMRPVDSALAQDIRHAFRAKPNLDAIRGDWRVASAVLSAPKMVLGATAEQMSAWRELAEQTHATEHLERKRKLLKLRTQTQRAANLAIERLQPALLRWTAQQSEAMKRLMAS